MFTAYVVVVVAAAVANAGAALVDFLRVGWVLDNMSRYGVPPSWLLPLGLAKAAGAVGLLVGLAVPVVGVAAAAGLLGYFAGAVVTVVRARWYSHLPFPGVFLVLAAGALALRLVTS